MHPPGSPFELYLQNTATPPADAMAIPRVDSFDESPIDNLQQLFLPTHFHRRPTPLSTSESTGTNSSDFSVPHGNLALQNYRASSTSSFESGWSNVQSNAGFVSVEQYRSLQARHNEMYREYVNLVKECDRLKAKNSVLKEAYEHLVKRIPACLSERIVYKREDYPNIVYWFRHEYFAALAEDRITCVDNVPVQDDEHNEVDEDNDGEGEDGTAVHEPSSGAPKGKRGKGRASQGLNVKMRYIQHENGSIIDGWRATDIRRYARSIFVGFALDGKVFHSWVEGADAASRTSYYGDMVTRFPELGLCELDWKSEQIASEIYSQWRTHWLNKQEAEKTKGKTSSKRLIEENLKDSSSQKKTKISRSRSRSVALGSSPADPSLPNLSADVSLPNSSPADFSDLLKVPQINVIAGTPARSAQAMGQVSESQFLTANLAFPPANSRPQYQFSINKPFAVAPSPLLSAPSSTLANPIHPAQGSSNLEQHHNMDSMQGSKDLAQEDTQQPSKRPNKMRVNKYSITPRNLCAKEWVEQHHGTVEQFATYFSALPPEELERFKALSKSLSSEKAA